MIRMKHIFMIILGCGAAAMLLSGCFGTEKLEQDVQESRQKRYQAMIHRQVESNAQDEAAVELWERLDESLSIDDCVAYALKNNKNVQIAKERLLEAKGQMTEAIASALPTVNITATGQRNDNSGFMNSKETYDATVLARQPIFLGGKIGTAVEAAKVFAYQKQQQLRDALLSAEFAVRRNYYDALLAKEILDVKRKSRDDSENHFKVAQAKFELGDITRYEMLQAKVNLNTAETDLIEQENLVQIAYSVLLDSMGVSQQSTIQLTDALVFDEQPIATKSCLDLAMQKRPDLVLAELDIRMARENLRYEKSGNLPNLYLQGVYTRSYPGFGTYFGSGKSWDRTMYGGFVVEWPIFNGFATKGKVTKAKSQLAQYELALLGKEQFAQLEIQTSLLTLENSRRSVITQAGMVANAEEALRLAKAGYKEGTQTSLEVISSEVALSEARSNYYQAVHGYLLAINKLHAAIGTLGLEPLPIN